MGKSKKPVLPWSCLEGGGEFEVIRVDSVCLSTDAPETVVSAVC